MNPEYDSRVIWIGNLPSCVDSDEIRSKFKDLYGLVLDVAVRESLNGRPNYAYVEFSDSMQAEEAIEDFRQNRRRIYFGPYRNIASIQPPLRHRDLYEYEHKTFTSPMFAPLPANAMNPFDNIGEFSIFAHIISFLDPRSRARLACVCRKFYVFVHGTWYQVTWLELSEKCCHYLTLKWYRPHDNNRQHERFLTKKLDDMLKMFGQFVRHLVLCGNIEWDREVRNLPVYSSWCRRCRSTGLWILQRRLSNLRSLATYDDLTFFFGEKRRMVAEDNLQLFFRSTAFHLTELSILGRLVVGSPKPRKKGAPLQQKNLAYDRCRSLLELAPIGVRRLNVLSQYYEPEKDELYVRAFFESERRLECVLLGGWLADANNVEFAECALNFGEELEQLSLNVRPRSPLPVNDTVPLEGSTIVRVSLGSPHLRFLALAGASLDDASVSALAHNAKNLEVLILVRCTPDTYDSVASILAPVRGYGEEENGVQPQPLLILMDRRPTWMIEEAAGDEVELASPWTMNEGITRLAGWPRGEFFAFFVESPMGVAFRKQLMTYWNFRQMLEWEREIFLDNYVLEHVHPHVGVPAGDVEKRANASWFH